MFSHMWGVKPRNKGKGLLSCVTRAIKVRTQVVQQKRIKKKIVQGMWQKALKIQVVGRKHVVKENNVKTMLRFNKEEEVEDLKIEPKLQVITTSWSCGICFVVLLV